MYSMKEACEATGFTYETLKYYCNEGLIPRVKRDGQNRRIFDEKDLRWIHDLSCLKRCRMSIDEMKHYLALCLEGASTIGERRAFLAEKKKTIEKEMEILSDSLAYIEKKDTFYKDVLAGKRPYVSNLIDTEASDGNKTV